MITDPDEPGYRYPKSGERLWHRPTGRWVVVESSAADICDEVSVMRVWDGQRLTVKLRSLDDIKLHTPEKFQ